jgi:Domain of unknown function (DUF5666)
MPDLGSQGTLVLLSGKEKSERKLWQRISCVLGRSASSVLHAPLHPNKPLRPKQRLSVHLTLRGWSRHGDRMNSDVQRLGMVFVLGLTLGGLLTGGSPEQAFAMPPTRGLQEAAPGGQDAGGDQRLPLLGKISAIRDNSIEVTDTNGENVTVKITGQTEFRKDRQPAKRTDFKVGDIILVRGQENPDHSWTAQVVAARSLNGRGGPGGPGAGRGGMNGGGGRGFQQAGTLGKDYVTGEIKSIDAPRLAVLRTDNVTQTLELNEETSLRKGRDSITMADIQVGDHLFARGAEENGIFVPKNVIVIGPEQWKRMQEFGAQARGEGGRQRRQQPASGDQPPAAPTAPVSPGNVPPPEPQR